MANNSNQKMLTPLELKVMDVLWALGKGFVKDILENWPDEPRPAYNTISTIVRILQDKKDFISHEAHGRTHEYYPLISKEEYQQMFIENAVEKVFSGSVSSLVSALMDTDNVSKEELDELKRLLDENGDS